MNEKRKHKQAEAPLDPRLFVLLACQAVTRSVWHALILLGY